MNNLPTSVIFVDIDGPMIPLRAYYMLNQTKPVVTMFDPCATGMLLKLISISQAKLVVSSTWGNQGYDKCMEVFEKNGINRSMFHEDWVTPRKMSSYRCHEIAWWLQNHSEVTNYVAIDDEDLPDAYVKNAVLCDAHEGFSWRNYLECTVFLNAYEDPTAAFELKTKYMIDYFKRREITRTVRVSDPTAELMQLFAAERFPN